MDPIYITDDIAVLKAAVVSGILTVSYAGPPARTITYQSLTAMRELLAQMVAQVYGATGVRKRYRLAATRKGTGYPAPAGCWCVCSPCWCCR